MMFTNSLNSFTEVLEFYQTVPPIKEVWRAVKSVCLRIGDRTARGELRKKR